jgi:amino acid adenylation domain-containing protein
MEYGPPAELEIPVPPDLAVRCARLAAQIGVRFGAILLAAHVKAMEAFTDGSDMLIEYREPLAGQAIRISCPPAREGGTWEELLRQADSWMDSAAQPASGDPQALIELADSSSPAPPVAAGRWLRFVRDRRRPSLGVRYPAARWDEISAARFLSYHLNALTAMTADPGAEHRSACLLSEDERRFQAEELNGRRKILPRARAHELFEERVRRHPSATAITCGQERLSYDTLNRRANQIGRALLERGHDGEPVVGVVMERTVDWAATVLALLKSGCAYLPVEPGYPEARISEMLARARCRTVITDRGSAGRLARALSGDSAVEIIQVQDVYQAGYDDADLGVPVAGRQLAYVCFTSGSTGVPKGAMCEHAGMLNHLLAKIDDFGLGADDVAAQTAPLCFGISLWQLLAPLLAGGQTVIVEPAVLLDVREFLRTLVGCGVSVVQLVPSYLEVVVSDLERAPRRLGRLRLVSATGEALPAALARRWFAACPGIPLANAYGLTETCDDTNHKIMREAPEADRVPLGRPVSNVVVAVVDDRLRPVPFGAPGEIVFSGACLGRGYLNDPRRTAAAFVADPSRPGGRLYRSGDRGRWRPGGELEYLGRRDTQVKVRGFRVETGEIESQLLRMPGVTGAAVVARPGLGEASLTAFFVAGAPISAAAVRDFLAGLLPGYLVPAAFRQLDALPLTANGKVDRRALAALESPAPASGQAGAAPGSAEEQWLASSWAAVLDLPYEQVSRTDDFFDSGGTSLSAIQLVLRTGRRISLQDITEHPILADLAAVAADRMGREERVGRIR